MAAEEITRTGLWQRAFGEVHDGYDEQRNRFASSLIRFRERVGNLLTFIPADMRHFTVHDLTHLDALWEMADLIAGDAFTLNPAEAFVFGGAVLLHDAGMSVPAYKEGLKTIYEMPEWGDALAVARSKCANDGADPSDVEAAAKANALTDLLRMNHAQKAEELASQSWANPDDGSHEYLLEDSDLRAHFGALIGTVAHSHHWGVKRLFLELQQTLGAFDTTPTTWSVDSVKVALLLRCADAAHVDHRRAPRLLFSMTRPVGVSLLHWSFQSKLAKPQTRDSKLLYTSKSPFTIKEVESWQLCWDAIKMIDRELSESCDALLDRKLQPFRVSGVVGAKSADALAKHIQVEGWRPVPTEIQVSDVPALARTLGGNDLYSNAAAPLREMIQNAADAIDARSAVDGEFLPDEARINVRIVREAGWVHVSVEDNGVGMSERTLTGALIDFGMSFWRSEAARLEFPGLQARFKPRGRYGIGFFSTFMWADNVKVSSRKFSEGMVEARVLEFSDGLGRRPILRPACAGEYSHKFSTRVTLKIREDKWDSFFRMDVRYNRRPENRMIDLRPDKRETISLICGMLKIPVYFDDGNSCTCVNLPDWESAPSDRFIDFIEKIGRRSFSEQERRFARSEAPIRAEGAVIGRAFLMPMFEEHSMPWGLFVYELGIFVGIDERGRHLVGFLEGRAGNAARDKVEALDMSLDGEWLARQIDYMRRFVDNIGEALACQDTALFHWEIIRELPLFLMNRKESSLNELLSSAVKKKKIRFSLMRESNHLDRADFRAKKVEGAAPFIGRQIDEDRVFFLTNIPGVIAGQGEVEEFIKSDASPFAKVLRELHAVLGTDYEVRVGVHDADAYSKKQIMLIDFVRNE